MIEDGGQVVRNDYFQWVLALADAFGFRPSNPAWYLHDGEEIGYLQWWERAPVHRSFTELETKRLHQALLRAEGWISRGQAGVPRSSNLVKVGQYTEMLQFLRSGWAISVIQGVLRFAQIGSLHWKLERGVVIVYGGADES